MSAISHRVVRKGSPAARRDLFWFALLVVAIYVLPVVLILSGVIPFSHRFTVLLAAAVVVFVIEKARHRTWRELGFRRDTLRRSLIWNGVLVLALGSLLLAFFRLGAVRPPTITGWSPFYLFYVFISCPSQEFLFRSAIFAEMRRVNITAFAPQVLLSALIYTFPHAIYRDAQTLAVVFAMGLIWGAIYRRFPNWYGVAASHAVLGVLSIATGLI